MTEREYTIRDIHMALDGEMPAEERRDYEIWLDAHPDMKAMSARFAADRARLQGVLNPVANEPVPDRLANILSDGRQAGADAGWRQWRSLAVAAAILASAAIGYFAGASNLRSGESAGEMIVERAIEAHVMYAAEKLHVVEVAADQKDHLNGWLSRRIGTSLAAPDFSAEGFQLVGGRLLPDAGHPAAQFMYQDRSGVRISLYVTPDKASTETGFRLYEEDGARAFYWVDGGYCYAIAGSVPEKTLLSISNAAYRQLLAGTTS